LPELWVKVDGGVAELATELILPVATFTSPVLELLLQF
jgi:hypothetical protein